MIELVRDVEVSADVHAELGEGPCWDAATNTLLFVDLSTGVIYRLNPTTGELARRNLGQEVGAVVPREGGGLVVAIRDGIAVLENDSAEMQIVAAIEGDSPGNRMNDAKCDQSGRLWAGTMAFDFARGAGSLYRIDRGYRYERMLSGTTISNGMDWSPSGDLMYWIDSGDLSVDVFRFDQSEGTLSDRRRLITFSDGDGLPDGMTVDIDGFLWIAMFGAGVVRRVSPDGRAAGQISLPVSGVTSLAFGGRDLEDLYITSGTYQRTADQLTREPHAGATFVCRPGTRGQASVPFRE
jgi:sugar lactone lactonase YvrE